MADFCNQCANDLHLEPGDLKGICTKGYCVIVICEDCGATHVDHLGNCIDPNCTKQHGKAQCPNSSSASPAASAPAATIGQPVSQFFARKTEALAAPPHPKRKKKAQ